MPQRQAKRRRGWWLQRRRVMIVFVMVNTASGTAGGAGWGYNLPALLTSLIGRERELEGVGEALRRGRLGTLSGPGGVGKTRLAVEVARRQVGRRRDDVWLVDLATGPAVPDVPAETARMLDIRSPGGKSVVDGLRESLRDRDLLLVLDNCEHVVDARAELAGALLTSCPGVRVLTTSREVLDVSGERVWRLDPLGADDARRLFVERARQRRPGFIPDARADATIGCLCERLDRLPLAIELAAARVGAMSVGEILSSLESQLGALSGGGRLAAPRHRTMRATVEWSNDLLAADERTALRSLAVLVGGFDAKAAMAVAPGLSVEMLARLVDKSLVSVAESPRGRTRYRLLETVREYENELLVQAGELDAARGRHLRHFSGRVAAERDSWPSLAARRQLEEMADDYENVRAALEWAAAWDPCAGMGLCVGAWDLFFAFAQADGVRLGERLLEACPARDRARVLAQISVGGLRMMQVDTEGVTAVEEDARLLSAELGEPALEGWARPFQGLAATLAGAVDAGREALTEALRLHRMVGMRSSEGKAIADLSAAEVKVARLVARGLPNKAIAAELHISVRTVESHVGHALAKAGLENRTQLATWARERLQ